MKKLKDFFYNKNDIIIVLIIIAVAGFIIYNRIGAIMDYPATYASKVAATSTAEETAKAEPTDATETSEPVNVSITIDDSDTSSSVADKLQAAGLITSADEFDEYVSDAGKSSSIQSGTFQIPSGSSNEEILNIITN